MCKGNAPSRGFLCVLLACVLVGGVAMPLRAQPTSQHDTKDVLRVVCLGDSITGWSDLSKYLKWSHILEHMLAARLGFEHVEVLNKGVGGDTSEQALARLERDVLAHEPDIVVILLGGNDPKGNAEKKAETRKHLAEIVSRTQKANARVLMMQYAVIPNPESPDTAWHFLDDNNDLIANVAEEHKAPVLNLAPPMKKAAEKYPQNELTHAKDGVHLRPRGELIVARQIFFKLEELGWIPKE